MTNALEKSVPIPLGFRWLSVGVGIASAGIGTIFFALLFPLVIDIQPGIGSVDYFSSLQFLFLAVAGIGILFSIIPGTFGGVYLAVLLERDASKKRLTTNRAVLRGAMAGGIAGIVTCLAGFLVVYSSFDDGLTLIFILIASTTVIASLMGALAGEILGKYLVKKLTI